MSAKRIIRPVAVCAKCGTSFQPKRKRQRYCSAGRYCHRPPAERLWARVDISDASDGCWEWTGNRDPNGYGRIGIGQTPVLVHRLSWELAYGPLPEGACVLHRCDNPPCVRPDHLFLGDRADNMRDAVSKGRQIQGVRVGSAKLTDDEVLFALHEHAQGVTQKAIAAMLGVVPSTIGAILKGRRWKHLTR